MKQHAMRQSTLKKPGELKVLIVDDQPEIRSMVREILLDMGVTQVFDAPDGKMAMSFIDTDFDAVNIIVCDWNMPGMTGIDFLRQIRSVFPEMPFLMVSGRSDKRSIIDAKQAGVSAYIRKPFSPSQFEVKLKILVDQ